MTNTHAKEDRSSETRIERNPKISMRLGACDVHFVEKMIKSIVKTGIMMMCFKRKIPKHLTDVRKRNLQ